MTHAEMIFSTGYAVFAVAVALAALLMRWQLEISKTWEPDQNVIGFHADCDRPAVGSIGRTLNGSFATLLTAFK